MAKNSLRGSPPPHPTQLGAPRTKHMPVLIRQFIYFCSLFFKFVLSWVIRLGQGKCRLRCDTSTLKFSIIIG